MARFIPFDKLNKLREAAKSGDENARKILRAQMNGEDFSGDLDNYFKPHVEEKESLPEEPKQSKLQEFLLQNNVKEGDPEYDGFVEDFYKEFPQEKENENVSHQEKCFLDDLIADEIEAIDAYNKAISEVLMLEEENDTSKKGMLDSLEEIKRDEIEHLDKLRRMKANLHKKEKVSE